MRVMMIARMPHKEFNAALKDGSVGQKMNAILEDLKPESVYFTEMNGLRTAVLVVNIEKSTQIPSVAEPWFLTFNADVEFHPTMSPEDLQQAGLDKLGKKWA